jgi:hypothetical protein
MAGVKVGVLRKNTFFYTMDGKTLKVRRGTKAAVQNGVLTFNPVEGVSITKLSGSFFINLWGSVHLLTFPQGGRTPFPLSML